MLYKFRGGIELEAAQHANGGGWVASAAHVAPAVYVGPNVEVIGGRIYGGRIYGGTIYGGTIYGGTIYGGTIWGGRIYGGTIEGGTIEGGTIEGGTITGGTIEGGTITGGTIEGGRIYGGTITGGTIKGGTIRKSPTFITGCVKSSVTITENFVGIGCKWLPPSYWIENGVAEFVAHGLPETEAKAQHALLLAFIAMHGCADETEGVCYV